MTIRKIEMIPPSNSYGDILYPKTSADWVTSTNGNVQQDLDNLYSGKADASHTHLKSEITDFPTLGTASAKNVGTSAGNVPELDSVGKLNASVLPAIAITDTFVVASETAMLALTAEVGDVAVRTDLKKSFILKTAGASTLANWQELLTPTDVVTSVAGKTGVVTLVASDVGLGNVTNESKATMFTSPAFTGTPTAPTAATVTNNTQIATTAFVKAQGYLTSITKAMVEAVLTGAITSHSHTGLLPAEHASSHITGGSDIIPNAVASGNSGLMSGTDKAKLDGIAVGAEVNVQSDWSATSGDALILNKPPITGAMSGYNLRMLCDVATPNVANGGNAFAEGLMTTASGNCSHSEGQATVASAQNAHSEGLQTEASGHTSHAEGNNTTASGNNSHAQNKETIAQGLSQTVIGEWNIAQGTVGSRVATDHAFIVGNGTADNARSNALFLTWGGNLKVAGDLEDGAGNKLSSHVHSYNNLTDKPVFLTIGTVQPTDGSLWFKESA